MRMKDNKKRSVLFLLFLIIAGLGKTMSQEVNVGEIVFAYKRFIRMAYYSVGQ